MFIELCTTCCSLHVCIRGCLSCFWGLRFLGELRLFALINGYYECLEHAHQFVSVNMGVSSCQVVLFWLLVSGMAIIFFKFFCCAIVLRGIRTLVLSLSRARVNVGGIW